MIYYLTALINGFFNSVNRMTNVRAGKLFGTANGALINYVEATVLSLLLMLVLTGFIFVGMPFIQAWGGAEYAPAYWVALLLIGPVTVPLIQNIGIEIQRAKNMHQFRSKVYFCMAIGNAIVSVPLGMKFGGIGCALGTAISMIVGNGFIMNWYYQTHIGLDMVYFWKRILGIVPAMLPAIALGVAAVRLHTFTGYSGVLTFAVPYAAVYAATSRVYLGIVSGGRERE